MKYKAKDTIMCCLQYTGANLEQIANFVGGDFITEPTTKSVLHTSWFSVRKWDYIAKLSSGKFVSLDKDFVEDFLEPVRPFKFLEDIGCCFDYIGTHRIKLVYPQDITNVIGVMQTNATDFLVEFKGSNIYINIT